MVPPTPSYHAPLKATLLLALMLCMAMSVGGVIGSWLLVVTLALLQDGLAGVLRITVSEHVFADLPSFIPRRSISYFLAMTAHMLIVVLGAAALGVPAQRSWKHLVVQKWRWMTENDVAEFFRRADDNVHWARNVSPVSDSSGNVAASSVAPNGRAYLQVRWATVLLTAVGIFLVGVGVVGCMLMTLATLGTRDYRLALLVIPPAIAVLFGAFAIRAAHRKANKE